MTQTTDTIILDGGSIGAFELARFETNQVGIPDFNIVLTNQPGDNGALVYDNVLSMGYNRGTGGKAISGKHTFFWNIESDYTTSQSIRQVEFYYGFVNASGTRNIRPFGITPQIDIDYCAITLRANSVSYGLVDGGNGWLNINSPNSDDADGGQMVITGTGSYIHFNGTDIETVMKWTGNALLGVKSAGAPTGGGNLAELAGGFYNADLFHSQSTTDTSRNYSLYFCGTNPRGIRFNSTKGLFEVQRTSTIWEPVIAAGSIDTNSLNGTANNWNPKDTVSRVLRLQAASASTVSGMAPTAALYDGQEHVLVNTSSYAITFLHQSTNSTAANRFIIYNGLDMKLSPGDAADMVYDGTTARWRVFKRCNTGSGG